MRNMQFAELGTPATKEQIRSAEILHNVNFPEEYKRFLL